MSLEHVKGLNWDRYAAEMSTAAAVPAQHTRTHPPLLALLLRHPPFSPSMNSI